MPIEPSMPIELLRYWEDQFFDEGENLDVLLIAAFEAGVKFGYEKCNDDHALSVVDTSLATVD